MKNVEQEWLRDCESICFDCGGTYWLKVRHDGVALCLWCRIKALYTDRR